MMPLITRTSVSEVIIPDEVIAEFIGYNPGLDMSQDLIIPVLRNAAIDFGEQRTGMVWRKADYVIEITIPVAGAIALPLSPAFAVSEVAGLEIDSWRLVPSDPENKRFWATVMPVDSDIPFAAGSYTLKVSAGWDEASFPESLKAWTLVRVATLYDYREDLVTGTITSNMPRDHAVGLLDRWIATGNPYA